MKHSPPRTSRTAGLCQAGTERQRHQRSRCDMHRSGSRVETLAAYGCGTERATLTRGLSPAASAALLLPILGRTTSTTVESRREYCREESSAAVLSRSNTNLPFPGNFPVRDAVANACWRACSRSRLVLICSWLIAACQYRLATRSRMSATINWSRPSVILSYQQRPILGAHKPGFCLYLRQEPMQIVIVTVAHRESQSFTRGHHGDCEPGARIHC